MVGAGDDEPRRVALPATTERMLEKLSPFELKARAAWRRAEVSAARRHTRMLDAGRGNPNWVATTPRAAFFLLGEFALTESRRVWAEPDLGGMPARDGIAAAVARFLAERASTDGAALLRDTSSVRRVARVRRGRVRVRAPTASSATAIPAPTGSAATSSGSCASTWPTSCSRARRPTGTGTSSRPRAAAICYVFDSLATNLLLRPGDRIALMVPAFTPYLEIPASIATTST